MDIYLHVCLEAAGEKELPLSYLFLDNDDYTGSDTTALIYKLHTSDTIKCVQHSSTVLILSQKDDSC